MFVLLNVNVFVRFESLTLVTHSLAQYQRTQGQIQKRKIALLIFKENYL